MDFNFEPFILSLRLATVTTLVLFLLSLPLAVWMVRSQWFFKPIVEALVSLPLVLPPTVLGFYLLVFWNPNGTTGALIRGLFDTQLVFTFEGLVVASVLYNLPFMVGPLKDGLQAIPPAYREASFVLGKSRLTTFLRIELPLMRMSIVTGALLTFAHTIGEFGVILMIGGNIPGETRVASIAIFELVESMDYEAAGEYALLLLGLSFALLLPIQLFTKRLRVSY